eukprot:8688811-Pyramimonas_sp.AAC.1
MSENAWQLQKARPFGATSELIRMQLELPAPGCQVPTAHNCTALRRREREAAREQKRAIPMEDREMEVARAQEQGRAAEFQQMAAARLQIEKERRAAARARGRNMERQRPAMAERIGR